MPLPTSLYNRETELGIKVVKRTLDELLPMEKVDKTKRTFAPSRLIKALYHRLYGSEKFLDLVVEEQKYFNDKLTTAAYTIVKERLPPRIDYLRLRIASLSKPSGFNVAMIKYAESIDTEFLKDLLIKQISGLRGDFEKNVLILKSSDHESDRVLAKVGRNVFYVSSLEASFMRNQNGWFLDAPQYDALLRIFKGKELLEQQLGSFEKSYIPDQRILNAIDLFDEVRIK